MITFHATARRQHDGSYRPMVIVRSPRGQCLGSRVSHVISCPTKEQAAAYAVQCAHKVAAEIDSARVA